jgi:hypothetical protein
MSKREKISKSSINKNKYLQYLREQNTIQNAKCEVLDSNRFNNEISPWG